MVGLRDYQVSKADIILKYTQREVRNLKSYGEFPDFVRINDISDGDFGLSSKKDDGPAVEIDFDYSLEEHHMDPVPVDDG